MSLQIPPSFVLQCTTPGCREMQDWNIYKNAYMDECVLCGQEKIAAQIIQFIERNASTFCIKQPKLKREIVWKNTGRLATVNRYFSTLRNIHNFTNFDSKI
jgi:hypothetical protein